MSSELSGRSALVTASSGGIGAAIARQLGAEGASVVVNGRDPDRAARVADDVVASGGRARVVLGDLDTAEGARDVAARAVEAFGDVDILVNNFGGRMESAGSVEFFSIDPELWNDTYNRNVTSSIRLVHLLAPRMTERGWGRIVFLGSFAAHSTPGTNAEYAATKGAILNVTLGLSKVLANSGVTVNAISPGMTRTAAVDRWLDSMADAQGFTGPGARERTVEWILANRMRQTVNRVGMPEDVANAAAFLCSPRSDFINGSNIRVDGGASSTIS
jgi:NAD(P)-dependent dehydrogenase (short-subunit alcohol dehydrogenase family)